MEPGEIVVWFYESLTKAQAILRAVGAEPAHEQDLIPSRLKAGALASAAS